jgi:hypothetical protein
MYKVDKRSSLTAKKIKRNKVVVAGDIGLLCGRKFDNKP